MSTQVSGGRMPPEVHSIRAFLEPDQIELGLAVGGFAADTVAQHPEPDTDDEGREQARELLETLGAAGWLRPIAELNLRACCLVREALGGASPLADAVFAIQGLATIPILLAENAEQTERWVGRLMDGTAMGGFAMTEAEAGSDVSALATRAVRDGDDYLISGEKAFISNAGIADVYVVFASTDPSAGNRGLSAFVIPADTPGFRFVEPLVMSAPHPLGRIAFDECRVPASARLGDEGEGFKLGMATLDRLRPTVGAAACGMAARALDEALTYAMERKQFGQPLADFQLIQQKLSRMATDLQAARLLVYRAAWEKDLGADRITLEAAMAKAFATEAAQRIVDDAVQIFGGRGVLRESVVDRLYRSVRALRIYEGATEIQHLIIAGQLMRKRKGSS